MGSGNGIKALILILAVAAAIWAAERLPWQETIADSSFRFLLQPTGWDIPYAIISYTSRDTYARALLVGLCNTLLAGALGILGATIVGFVVGLAAATGNAVLSGIARLYVDVIRNIPLIIQAMFWYAVVLRLPSPRGAHEFLGAFLSNRGLFLPRPTDPVIASLVLGAVLAASWIAFNVWRRHREGVAKLRMGWDIAALVAFVAALVYAAPDWRAIGPALALDWPQLAGLNFRGGLRLPLELAALTAALTFYRGAFLAEIFRAGFRAVSQGQVDAAKALGLSPLITLIKIRIPLALVSIMPPLTGEYMIVLKVTSIGIVVGFTDIYSVASSSSSLTGRPLEVIFVMILAYLVINYTIAVAMDFANRRFQIPGRKNHG
ncbi:MAG: ABC transporter permease subunit [Alphaproteobacteria bacterium]|nr:ABC transporter permease subunit [Alphaproteobacteria bacterium]